MPPKTKQMSLTIKMMPLLLCNHRTLLPLKENIGWENCAGLGLWCQHPLPGYNSDSDSEHPFKSHSMKDVDIHPRPIIVRCCEFWITRRPGIVNCIRCGIRLRLAWWQLLATRTLADRVFLTVSRYLWRWDLRSHDHERLLYCDNDPGQLPTHHIYPSYYFLN